MTTSPWLDDIMHACLPSSPVSAAAFLSAAISDDGGGEDRLSALSDDLLCNVVSRLPVKDAARTDALSQRWRGLWRGTHLVLDDSHLLPDGRPMDWSAPAAAVSRILASHPGPFRCVRLANNLIDASKEDALAEWLRLLADKGVEDLTLVNRPLSFDVPVQLPPSLLCCGASLRRLYLGVWLFPFTTGLLRSPDVFPHLQELRLCHTVMEEHDLEHVLACSPDLQILALIASSGIFSGPSRARISSDSVRCVLLWSSMADELALVDAPRLQRLILHADAAGSPRTMKVQIGYAPDLTVLGYLETATHVLVIGNTTITVSLEFPLLTFNWWLDKPCHAAYIVRFAVTANELISMHWLLGFAGWGNKCESKCYGSKCQAVSVEGQFQSRQGSQDIAQLLEMLSPCRDAARFGPEL
jgi:hypothetical protein